MYLLLLLHLQIIHYQDMFYAGGTGTDTTVIGGIAPPSSSTNTVNEYNGSTYSSAPNYPVSVYAQGMSTNSPGSNQRIAGGRTYPGSGFNTVNTYDGSSFSSAPSLSVARYLHLAGGPSSAMTVLGGDPAPSANNREDWNGSSWSSGTMIPSGRHVENGMSMVGSASDLTVAGGRDGPAQPYPGVTYNWDGSSWSTLAPRPPSLPSSHSGNNLCFGSSSSDFYSVGGEYPGGNYVDKADKYDGTSWATAVATILVLDPGLVVVQLEMHQHQEMELFKEEHQLHIQTHRLNIHTDQQSQI